jgi:hypothetical protein
VVNTVTAVPPEKSIPGFTGNPVWDIVMPMEMSANMRRINGMITICFGV